MNNWRKNVSLILTVIFVTALGIAQPACAAPNSKTVQAYPGVTIIYNGQQLTDTTPSYIIDGTTYIPLRMLMSSFGKGVQWDAASKKVTISDVASSGGASAATTSNEIMALQKQIDQLQSTITSLSSKIGALENDSDDDDTSLSDIKNDLNDYFEDAGDDYFGDDGITTTISLSGDEDDLAYTIKLDFDDASDYDNLKELNQTKIKSLMTAVKSRISSKTDGTDYEDADITGKLADNDTSSYYVNYNGSSFTFSWNSTSISQIQSDLNDYFEDAGDDYFSDDGITTDITLSGDEDDLAYIIELDLSSANDYSSVKQLSETRLQSLMSAVKSRISSEADGTDYEDADITGRLYDSDSSTYYVIYNGSSYNFSWD